MAVSFRAGHVRGRLQCQEGELGLLASPCPQAVRLGGSARRESGREAGLQVVLLPLKSPTGKCLTCVGHWAASWKNLMSLHSTPSMDTGGSRERRGDGAVKPSPHIPQECHVPSSPAITVTAPLSMVCCCLAEQMRRLMPSMTWLFESTSFSRGFLLRKMVGTTKSAGTTAVCHSLGGYHPPS